MINIKFKNRIGEKEIQFNIDYNYRCAILGENGIGKSSILQSISNKKSLFDFIEVEVPSNLKIEYFKQLEENNSLSGGEHTKKRLEEIFSKDADLYVLDEPTNNLDEENINWLKNLILNSNKKIIFTSHDIHFIDAIAESIYYIDSRSVEKTKEKCSSYLVTRKQKVDTLYSEYEANLRKQQQLVKTGHELKEKAKRGEKHIRPDNDKLEQGLNRDGAGKGARVAKKILERAENLDVERPEYDPIPKIAFRESDNKKALFSLQISTLNKQRLNIEVKNNSKLIIAGNNGIGKTTLLNYVDRILKGGQVQSEDMFSRYSKFDHLYISQDWYEKLDEIFVKDYAQSFNLADQEIIKSLSLTYLERNILNKKFNELSPGTRIKVLLGILSLKSYDLIIWDEPTNHLDVLTQVVLGDAFIKYNGALILVTHDTYFINNDIYEILSLR